MLHFNVPSVCMAGRTTKQCKKSYMIMKKANEHSTPLRMQREECLEASSKFGTRCMILSTLVHRRPRSQNLDPRLERAFGAVAPGLHRAEIGLADFIEALLLQNHKRLVLILGYYKK